MNNGQLFTEMGINMRLLKRNEGFTILELIITIGIAAVLITMLALIISTAAKSYRNSNNKSSLQKEALITMNQLAAILMEAEAISTGSAVAPDKNYLLKGSADSPSYSVYFQAENNRLFLISADTIEEADSIDPTIGENLWQRYLLADYVDSIRMDTSSNTVDLIITYVKGNSEYSVQKKINMRNKK